MYRSRMCVKELNAAEAKEVDLVTPNVKLSGRQQRAVLDSERKMGRKALRSMAGAARCWRSA